MSDEAVYRTAPATPGLLIMSPKEDWTETERHFMEDNGKLAIIKGFAMSKEHPETLDPFLRK